MRKSVTEQNPGKEGEIMIGLYFQKMLEKIIALKTFLALILTERLAKFQLRDLVEN